MAASTAEHFKQCLRIHQVTARTRRRHKLPAETTQRDLARNYPPALNRRALRTNRRQTPTLRHSTARTQESATRNRAPEDPGHAPTNAKPIHSDDIVSVPETHAKTALQTQREHTTVHHNHIYTRRHGFRPTVHSHSHSHFHPPPTLKATRSLPCNAERAAYGERVYY